MRWRAYYEDGSVCDDSTHSPADLPPVGLLCIRQRNDCSHHPDEWLKPENNLMGHKHVFSELLEGADWYWWREDTGRWVRGDMMGLIDQFMHCGARFLKQGRYASHEVWEQTMLRVTSDRDFA